MAASACINTIGFSPENFFISMSDQDKLSDLPDPDDLPVADFEFRSLEDPVIMLPADQLFSDGKLIPLHHPTAIAPSRRVSVSVTDPFAYSSKAPSRWKQLLGFRKNNNNNNIARARSDENGNNANANANANANGATKSIKQFLQRGSSKSPNENLPLLKDTDNEVNEPTSSRLSLSSSSSGHDPEELPRVSVDSEKPAAAGAGKVNNPPPRMRMVKVRRAASSGGEGSGSSVRIDSPRMNSSGKIVFERSSSSPSSLKQRGGMERSYSGNVRVSRVLNVPVCSVRKSGGGVFGLPLFSSPQNQKPGGGGGSRKSKTSLG